MGIWQKVRGKFSRHKASKSPAPPPGEEASGAANAPQPQGGHAGTAGPSNNAPSHLTADQKKEREYDVEKDGPAAAGGAAQQALQHAQQKPATSTDPDAGIQNYLCDRSQRHLVCLKFGPMISNAGTVVPDSSLFPRVP